MLELNSHYKMDLVDVRTIVREHISEVQCSRIITLSFPIVELSPLSEAKNHKYSNDLFDIPHFNRGIKLKCKKN